MTNINFDTAALTEEEVRASIFNAEAKRPITPEEKKVELPTSPATLPQQ